MAGHGPLEKIKLIGFQLAILFAAAVHKTSQRHIGANHLGEHLGFDAHIQRIWIIIPDAPIEEVLPCAIFRSAHDTAPAGPIIRSDAHRIDHSKALACTARILRNTAAKNKGVRTCLLTKNLLAITRHLHLRHVRVV